MTETPAAPGPRWDFTFELPRAWIHVDFDAGTRRETTGRLVEAAFGRAPEEAATRAELTELMMTLGSEADAQRALVAGALYVPTEAGLVTASLMLLLGQRSRPDDPAAEIDALRRRFEQPDEYDFGPRTVEVVDLPAGRAVRLRAITEPEGRVEDPAVILDTVQYWVPVPGQPDMVVVAGATPSLGYGDEIAAQVDAAARTLRFGFSGELTGTIPVNSPENR